MRISQFRLFTSTAACPEVCVSRINTAHLSALKVSAAGKMRGSGSRGYKTHSLGVKSVFCFQPALLRMQAYHDAENREGFLTDFETMLLFIYADVVLLLQPSLTDNIWDTLLFFVKYPSLSTHVNTATCWINASVCEQPHCRGNLSHNAFLLYQKCVLCRETILGPEGHSSFLNCQAVNYNRSICLA